MCQSTYEFRLVKMVVEDNSTAFFIFVTNEEKRDGRYQSRPHQNRS